jgi:hypothetical protein
MHTLPNNIIKLYKYYPFDVNYQINSKMPGFNQCAKSNVCSAGYAPKTTGNHTFLYQRLSYEGSIHASVDITEKNKESTLI